MVIVGIHHVFMHFGQGSKDAAQNIPKYALDTNNAAWLPVLNSADKSCKTFLSSTETVGIDDGFGCQDYSL